MSEQRKLVLSKETLKSLSVKTGVAAGDVEPIVFPPDPGKTASCTSCTCGGCAIQIGTSPWVINPSPIIPIGSIRVGGFGH